MSPEERSWKGMFLAFQYPVEIPGVSNNFLRTVLNERNGIWNRFYSSKRF